jgi:transposase
MKSRKFREYDRDQMRFMNLSIDGLLEDKHPARVIDRIVEKLDLSKILDDYGSEGKPAYHPAMMLKILFYSYMKGIMSCRKIWDSMRFRADYIFLSAGNYPDFRTINTFRTRHIKDLPGLFAQIVMMAVELGLVDFEHLAIDGQNIHANANLRKTYNLIRIKERFEQVQKGMNRILSENVNIEDLTEKDQQRHAKLKAESERLESMKTILEELKQNEDDNPEQNTTDPEAPNLKFKDHTIKPAYNHQSAVDSKHGITVAVQTQVRPDNSEDLLPLVDQATTNAGSMFQNVSADSAFGTYETYHKLENRQEDFFIPDRSFTAAKRGNQNRPGFKKIDFTRGENGEIICPAGKPMVKVHEKQKEDHLLSYYIGKSCPACALHDDCTKAKYRQIYIDSREVGMMKMRAKLTSKEGILIYQKRQGTVEPTHGHDQKNRGWKQHHLRSYARASLEFILMRISSNLFKIANYAAPDSWVFV